MNRLSVSNIDQKYRVRFVVGRRTQGVTPVRDHQGLELGPGDGVTLHLPPLGNYATYFIHVRARTAKAGEKIKIELGLPGRQPHGYSLKTKSGPGYGYYEGSLHFQGASVRVATKSAAAVWLEPDEGAARPRVFVWGTSWTEGLQR